MSRLQKKCFFGATGFHLVLLAALIVGPVFLSPGESDPTPVLEFIPTILTDSSNQGGGNPRPPSPSPTPTPTPPAPQPQPPERQPVPQPASPKREPDPPKAEKVKEAKPDPDSPEPKPEKKLHQVQLSDTIIKVPRDKKTTTKPTTDTAAAAAAANARANAQRQQQFAKALQNISSGLTPSTKIEIPDGPDGPGGGGPSYANYGQEVRRIYTEAWRIPQDVTDDEATVKVSVTIARDGHVIASRSRIIQSSGSKLVDRSIQATLDRVTFVRPFPDGAKDAQKTFNISFSLKAKKLG